MGGTTASKMGKGGSGDDTKIYIAILMLSSLIEMWAAAAIWDSLNVGGRSGWNACIDNYAFAVAAGAISLFICIIMTILFCAAQGMANSANPFVAVLLFLLWGAGVGVCTFGAPFYGSGAVTGNRANGYFATWISFIASTMYMMKAVPQIANVAGKAKSGSDADTVIWIIFFASVAEMWAAAYICDSSRYFQSGCQDLPAWGVSCGAISDGITLIIIICGLLKCTVPPIAMKIISVILCLLWAAGVATLTFAYKTGWKSGSVWGYGLFANVDNGYLGTWIAFFGSFVLMYISLAGGSLPTGGKV